VRKIKRKIVSFAFPFKIWAVATANAHLHSNFSFTNLRQIADTQLSVVKTLFYMGASVRSASCRLFDCSLSRRNLRLFAQEYIELKIILIGHAKVVLNYLCLSNTLSVRATNLVNDNSKKS